MSELALSEAERADLRDWYDIGGRWIERMSSLYRAVEQILARRVADARLTPPLTNGCWDCGRLWSEPGWVDAWIPDDLWRQIAPIPTNDGDHSGYLCIHCITAALTRIGATEVPVELWAAPYKVGGPVPEVRVAYGVVLDDDGSVDEYDTREAAEQALVDWGGDYVVRITQERVADD